MMDIGVALVFTVGGIIGSILITQMWQLNYFKRENFKFGLAQKRKEYTIKFKKLEKDLGLKEARSQNAINPNVISNLADTFLGSDEDQEDNIVNNPVVQGILTYAGEHPELTKKILSQVGIGGGNNQDEIIR